MLKLKIGSLASPAAGSSCLASSAPKADNTFHQRLRFVLLISFMLFTGGCFTSSPAVRPEVPPTRADSSPAGSEPLTPFELTVVEDAHDGKSLVVHGRIVAASSWPADDVVVRVTGVHDGQPKDLAYYPLPALLSNDATKSASILAAGEPLDFYVTVPSTGISDYQLQLLWGKEATLWKAGAAARGVQLRALKVRELQSAACEVRPCASTYSVSGEFFNDASEIVQKVRLGVGFVWQPEGRQLDLSKRIPEDEEPLEISGLNLGPQQTQPFELELDKAVPGTPGGRYVPVLRVITFE